MTWWVFGAEGADTSRLNNALRATRTLRWKLWPHRTCEGEKKNNVHILTFTVCNVYSAGLKVLIFMFSEFVNIKNVNVE